MSDGTQPFRAEFPRGRNFPAGAPAQPAADRRAFPGPLR